MTRVVLVEDDPRYRESLETLLRHTPGFEAVRTFGNARRMLAAAGEAGESDTGLGWDLVLMDLELPDLSGVEATRRFKVAHPAIPVVVLTSFEEPTTILQAICAGANGYLLKKSPAGELIAHLRAVVRGGAPLTAEIARSVLDVIRRYEPGTAQVPTVAAGRLDLSEREQDVLRCLSHGLTYQSVAEDLGLTVNTVRDHVKRIYRKLQVHSAAEAVSRAVREGLI
jgi:DNA-binding NarL/FixJ family response regulator